MGFEVGNADLKNVDWNRHSVGFGPTLLDPKQQEIIKTVHFSATELKILRLLLTREVPGTDLVPAKEYDGLKTLTELVTGWEEWMLARAKAP